MENRKSGFKIDMNDEGPNSYIRTGHDPVQKRIEARRLDKINRRITWISILLPCLVCVIVLAAYLDLKKNFSSTNNTLEIKTFTQNLEARLTALAGQYKKIEESLNTKENPYNEVFLAYETTTGALEKSLQELQNRINDIDLAKADKTQMETSVNALKDEIQKLSENMAEADKAAAQLNSQVKEQVDNQVKEQIKAISSDIQASRDELKKLKEKMSLELEESLAKINESSGVSKQDIDLLSSEIKKVKKDVIDVLADTIDRKTLNSELGKQDRIYKKEIDFIVKTLGDKEDSIRSLKSSVQNLETRIKTLSRKQMGIPEPGKVLEQDL
ncbi:hypothetical protein [Desulfonema limicola]|nr:hypothetical protein [Desulfonema limicola]